ncbi:MAG: hypothetical protein K8R25_16195 [Methanosarcinales archaeon]|nr:hypothetical protein [Methanosarcinales archaeon]
MGIENITLINTDSFMLGVREVIIGVIAGVITTIIGYYLIEKRRARRQIKQEEENKQIEKKEQEEANKREKLEQEGDKERIYNWLYNETKDSQEITIGGYTNVDGHIVDTLIDPRWRSTKEIASSNNLTVERVKELCYINEKLKLMTEKYILPNEQLEEKWAIKEFVDNQ